MAVQSVYADNMSAAYEGMIADETPNTLISRTVETAAIGFGKAVKQGTGDHGVAAAAADTDAYIGITVRDQSIDPANVDLFAVGDTALIMTEGAIWVTAHDTVIAGAAVYMNVSSKKFTDTSTSNLAIPNAVFETSGAADELVRIRLR